MLQTVCPTSPFNCRVQLRQSRSTLSIVCIVSAYALDLSNLFDNVGSMSPNDTSPVDKLKPVTTPELGTSDRNDAIIESAAAQIQSDSPYVKELQR